MATSASGEGDREPAKQETVEGAGATSRGSDEGMEAMATADGNCNGGRG
jgi:hypothetical protein